MFSISILLNAQGHHQTIFLLPATIVLGATISTIVVLRKLRYDRHDTPFPSEILEELKQRIENLETIAASDDRYWDHRQHQNCRAEIAADAQQRLVDFRSGKCRPQSVQSVIAECVNPWMT